MGLPPSIAMAALVIEDTLLVVYATWREWRDTRVAAHRDRPPLVEPGTAPCGRCWGQGRFLEPAGNGEGLVRRPCLPCLGQGRVPIR
jgi:hypothetical protein